MAGQSYYIEFGELSGNYTPAFSMELKKVDDLVVGNRVCIKENRVYNNNFLLADEIALYILD